MAVGASIGILLHLKYVGHPLSGQFTPQLLRQEERTTSQKKIYNANKTLTKYEVIEDHQVGSEHEVSRITTITSVSLSFFFLPHFFSGRGGAPTGFGGVYF